MARGPLAGAAGPGKFSKRTDLPSTSYGEGVETKAIKDAAPMAKTADVRPMSRSAMGMAPSQITPLYAPSERPDEEVTAGVAVGPGPGPEVLGGAPAQGRLSDALAQMLPYDTTGEITVLYQEALARGN
jgi:hypothetical protein